MFTHCLIYFAILNALAVRIQCVRCSLRRLLVPYAPCSYCPRVLIQSRNNRYCSRLNCLFSHGKNRRWTPTAKSFHYSLVSFLIADQSKAFLKCFSPPLHKDFHCYTIGCYMDLRLKERFYRLIRNKIHLLTNFKLAVTNS